MKRTKLLITGASGFIGGALSSHFSRLADDFELRACLDGAPDLLDEEAVKAAISEFRPDCVVNCAAVGGTRKTGYDTGASDVAAQNIRIFTNLARSLGGARLIQLGSGAEYDSRHYKAKMPETYFDTHVPRDAYGYSKYVISRLAENVPDAVCLRIFGIFGPNEDYTYKFITNSVVKNLLGLPITINQNARFDYLWIDDFCRITESFVRKDSLRYKHYNACPTVSADLVELAGLVNEVSGTPVEVKALNPGISKEYSGDNSRLLSELPGFSFTGYREAIERLFALYRASLDKMDVETVRRDPYLKFCVTKENL